MDFKFGKELIDAVWAIVKAIRGGDKEDSDNNLTLQDVINGLFKGIDDVPCGYLGEENNVIFFKDIKIEDRINIANRLVYDHQVSGTDGVVAGYIQITYNISPKIVTTVAMVSFYREETQDGKTYYVYFDE